MLEEIVCTPWFLPNQADALIHCTMMKLAREGEVEVGDMFELKYLGATKDTDGWPMKRWAVRLYKGR
jgi:hypothetical protein